mmetsp:Transcript_13831/g.19991  ORF Transcript_13831/g.19991 Transcript_13831/m.19991 type:complete len:100 (+) Transcript_13831:2066-2365(+)
MRRDELAAQHPTGVYVSATASNFCWSSTPFGNYGSTMPLLPQGLGGRRDVGVKDTLLHSCAVESNIPLPNTCSGINPFGLQSVLRTCSEAKTELKPPSG